MKCNTCGTNNSIDSKFCKECGQKIEVSAPIHGTSTDEQIRIGELIYAAYKHKETGEIDEAMIACNAALDLNVDSAPARSLLGSLYELNGDIESAISEYEKALAINPKDDESRNELNRLRGRLKVISPSRFNSQDLLSRLKPYTSYGLAAASFCMVLAVGLGLVYATSGKPKVDQQTAGAASQGESAQVAPPVQEGYDQQQYPQGQYGQQGYPEQDDEAEPQNPAQQAAQTQPTGQNQTSRGIPSIPIPRPAPQVRPTPAPQGQPQYSRPVITPLLTEPAPVTVRNEPPVIVPVDDAPITPVGSSGSGTVTVHKTSGSGSVTRSSVSAERRAVQLHREGKYQEAVAGYQEALSQSSDRGRLYQQMGICYQRLGDKNKAVDSYKRALRSYGDKVAAGGDPVEAQRNMKACEAGIKANEGQ